MEHLTRTIAGITGRGARQLFIDGDWRAATGTVQNQVIAPHTEEVLLSYVEPSAEDADAAVAAARRAFDDGPWPRMAPEERGAYLTRVAGLLRARMPELAEAWTGQVGAVLGFTSKASHQVPGLFDYYAGLTRTYPFVEERTRSAGGKVRVVAEPAGVCLAVTPWNAPLVLLTYKVAAALAAGCTMVAKPSPETPIDAHILAECLAEAGLPAGVFNLLPGGREIGDHLVRHPGVDKISFTGSTAAGRHIAGVAAERLARVGLELGGKSAAMILPDADIATVLPSLVPYSMPITGQVCFSLTRVLVPASRKEEIVDAYAGMVGQVQLGDPFAAGTGMGPLAMARQLERVQSYIDRGQAEGATLHRGGGRPTHLDRGFFIEPTIFTDVEPGMAIFQEEIFGPVVSFITYADEADMIAKANATEYGLHGAVYTADPEHGYAIARQYRAGSVTINGMIVDIEMPFGGFKQSGIGREGGVEGLAGYTETKAIYFA
ncbi:aldehyde dehydrogenase [Croceibacterium mercuriale]|uniref:Aldehyde dehydrogenase n=1 Tax=Croceibacterium mercuriale TaxID=1572751 RepID=A0A0B2BXC3_9SPHN|nr:aldehyde dehydrogenase [Croceibacterium mercuriale]KHL24515.1 aldehyde dehydrogenase [Croceibacterium mercuriale]